MSQLKAVVIGAGQIAQAVHIPAYTAKNSVAELVAICDVDIQAALALKSALGIPFAYQNHLEMLEAVKPDIVSICVPNRYHYPIAMDALRAGCHVFCEKPPTLTVAQSQEIHALAQQKGKIVSYNFHHRLRPEIQSMKKMAQNGELGQIYAVEVQAVRRRAIPGWGSFTNRQVQGGGALIDLGIHMLDSALYILDYPKPVYACASMFDYIGKQGGIGAFGSWDGASFTVEDALFGMVRFETGLTFHITTSFALHNGQSETTRMNLNLYGDVAGCSLLPFALHTNEQDTVIERILPTKGGYSNTAVLMDFIKCVVDGSGPAVTAKNTLPTQKLVEALYQSAQEGKPVLFE